MNRSILRTFYDLPPTGMLIRLYDRRTHRLIGRDNASVFAFEFSLDTGLARIRGTSDYSEWETLDIPSHYLWRPIKTVSGLPTIPCVAFSRLSQKIFSADKTGPEHHVFHFDSPECDGMSLQKGRGYSDIQSGCWFWNDKLFYPIRHQEEVVEFTHAGDFMTGHKIPLWETADQS